MKYLKMKDRIEWMMRLLTKEEKKIYHEFMSFHINWEPIVIDRLKPPKDFEVIKKWDGK